MAIQQSHVHGLIVPLSRRRSMLDCFAALAMTMLVCSAPAYATPRDELAQTKKEQKTSEAKAAKLADDMKKLESERKKLQEELVAVAKEVQKSEAELSALEEKLRVLAAQIQQKTADLAARKKELATTVQAAIKLSQTPKEAIILMPGDMQQNMKAGRALSMMSDSVKREAESIRLQMAELEALKETVVASQQAALEKRKTLDAQRAELKTKMAERDKLQAQLNAQHKQAADKARELAKKAADLQDLIGALDREAREQAKSDEGQELEADESAPAGTKGKLRSFAAAKGRIRPPVAGRVEQGFGVASRNETSKGLTILARRNAQVVAPYDGEVLFTGPFLAYGRMIILRHKDGYHTLLAGLSKIDASVGQFLLEGEPIGAMGDKESGNRLYVELRKNSQPVDPAPWIKGLK